MSETVLDIKAVAKSFGGLSVLKDVSFSVAKGERRGIIGPNGAGKTTLFNVISGYLPPTAGRVVFQGADVTQLPAHRRARLGLGRTFQIVALFDKLSVIDNVLIGLAVKRGRIWRMLRSLRDDQELCEAADRLLTDGGLWELRDRPVAQIAYGHRKMLEIVMALTTDAKVLLLDEPAAGLSKEETLRLIRLLDAMDPDLTIVLIEHDMEVMFQTVDRITVLDRGTVLMEGSVDEVRSSAAVHERYLGVTPDDEGQAVRRVS
jgi:branched-chain amino acid transport system ATP-binding protein